jgi:prepilin-type N-terminal cleavage/methylation domain-containing protein
MRVQRSSNLRQGFTLVEILMVVAIIGILVGLLVPAVGIAYTSVKRRTIALECQSIANAVEQYKNKFGDYPPDGSDLSLLTRHLRKVFPQIHANEIQLLTGALTPTIQVGNLPASPTSTAVPGAVMDPPEAVVFFLGGFSSDPVFPLTGPGGPFYILNGSGVQINSSNIASAASIQYNVDRSNSLFEFKQTQLTIDNSSGFTQSTEDTKCGGALDLLPTYVPPYGLQSPYVYFDARTYMVGGTTGTANHYNTLPDTGIIAPYRSTEINTKATGLARFRWMNEKSFQLLSAGLDDHYGGSPNLFYMYKPQGANSSSTYNSGDSLDASGTVGTNTGFRDSDGSMYQYDNVANFSDGPLIDSVSN